MIEVVDDGFSFLNGRHDILGTAGRTAFFAGELPPYGPGGILKTDECFIMVCLHQTPHLQTEGLPSSTYVGLIGDPFHDLIVTVAIIVSTTALLIFLAAAAGTGVVSPDLGGLCHDVGGLLKAGGFTIHGSYALLI